MRPTTLGFAVLVTVVAMPAQNSARKIRQPPGQVASRAGSAVQWRIDLEGALQEAKEQHKPLFWYVPTLRGSPMDRKPELDRYLMAGPFTWPSTVQLLNQHFVPLKLVPDGELQRRYGLVRLKFIEPGWLVLDGDGAELQRLDQIVSFNPQWFEAPLRRLCGQPQVDLQVAPALRPAWELYRGGRRGEAVAAARQVLLPDVPAATRAEARFLIGAALCRDNRRLEADAVWTALAEDLPGQPFAWQAAMEAEGHGPFARGFEDFLPLPPIVLRDLSDGSRAPRGSYTEAQLWQRSVAFLLAMDDGDGVIRDSIYDFGGTDSLPNVYAAVSCLVGTALLEAAARAPALGLDERTRGRIGSMLDRLAANAGNDALLAKNDRDEILWAYGYRMRFLARWIALRPDDKPRLAAALQRAVDALEALQPDTGVWFHEYGNPFAIATALQSLSQAKAGGAVIDQERIDRGLRALVHCKAKNGVYSYGYSARTEARSALEFGAGRAPLCELALRCWNGSDDDKLAAVVGLGMQYHPVLAAVRKYDDHADQYRNGGFFFWYDMLGRAEAIMALPPGADRDRWQAQQKKLVLDLPEFDGCFVDSHELGRAYGTAMALLCFAALQP